MRHDQSNASVAASLASVLSQSSVFYAADDETSVVAIAELLRAMMPEATVVHVPASDAVPGERTSASPINIGQRISALRQIAIARETSGTMIALITSGEALASSYAASEKFKAAPPEIVVDATCNHEALSSELEAIGYRRDDRVDEPGEYGIHGQVIDVFPVDAARPVRIETAEGRVVSIRTYDPVDQLTLENLKRCSIGRAAEPDVGKDPVSLADHLPDARMAISPAAEKARKAFLQLVADTTEISADGQNAPVIPDDMWVKARACADSLLIGKLDHLPPRFVEDDAPLEAALAYVNQQRDALRRVILFAGPRDVRFLRRHFDDSNEIVQFKSWTDAAASDAPFGTLAVCADRGFVWDNVCVIAGADLLGSRAERHSGAAPSSVLPDLFTLSDIHIGDVVVHEDHGLARVDGIVPMPHPDGGEGGDAVQLTFAKETVRLVPVAELDRVWRYGGEPEAVTLDTVNGTSWGKRRAKIETAVADTARTLVALAEQRNGGEAPVLSPPVDAYERFCAGFKFSETADQLRAIDAILSDLASGKPMDRLVIGDVGYGKTEVALRAAAIAALSGFQVAVTAPTSVLARQHYETFRRRFSDCGIEVAMLSKLTGAAEARRIRQGLEDGTIDVVVGTGAVAGAAVSYARLALVVIDEEQRFGAKDKEKLRALSAGHSLSLSATPIPRSLQAALVGLQDLSVLATPPARRQPIATHIAEDDDTLLRTALLGEKMRKGQSFVVVPRITDIAPLAKRLKKLVPELSVISVHGRMKADEIDQAMVGFADGEGDVLLATNIIEAGLDVPRANTMVVMHADMFGLAQLHQLRGRVGRGAKRGSILLTTAAGHELAPHTVKRLSTLAAFDSLGAGFAISARDLDQRGAGDLTGDDQSGHMKLIGGDLYQFLLEGAVRAARGEAAPERWTPKVNIGIEGALPGDWICDENVRVGLYARAARLTNQGELRTFTNELRDRFGRLPATARMFVRMVQVRLLAKRAGIAKVDGGPAAIALSPKLDQEICNESLEKSGDRYVLSEKILEPTKRLQRARELLEAV